eukprot:3258070-Rhodomonas_salina.4
MQRFLLYVDVRFAIGSCPEAGAPAHGIVEGIDVQVLDFLAQKLDALFDEALIGLNTHRRFVQPLSHLHVAILWRGVPFAQPFFPR